MIKVGIIGATGYAGAELVRILMNHREAHIEWFGSRSYIDENYADVYQNFFELVDAKCMDDNMAALADEVDVIFTATPQGLCASLVNEEILSKAKVIDLSADFRIKDVKVYELNSMGLAPDEFIWMYHHCRKAYTMSFHGVAFSLIFGGV